MFCSKKSLGKIPINVQKSLSTIIQKEIIPIFHWKNTSKKTRKNILVRAPTILNKKSLEKRTRNLYMYIPNFTFLYPYHFSLPPLIHPPDLFRREVYIVATRLELFFFIFFLKKRREKDEKKGKKKKKKGWWWGSDTLSLGGSFQQTPITTPKRKNKIYFSCAFLKITAGLEHSLWGGGSFHKPFSAVSSLLHSPTGHFAPFYTKQKSYFYLV